MKLKYEFATKADFDAAALPEAVKALYHQDADGAMVLDIEGAVSQAEYEGVQAKLVEFRDNNRKLHADVKKFEGIDPEKYKQLSAEIETFRKRGVNAPDDVQAAIQNAVAAAVAPLQKSVEEERTLRTQSEERLQRREFEDQVWNIGVKAGVREEAKDFFVSRVAGTFKRDESGKLVAVGKNGEPVYSKRRNGLTNPLSIDEFATEWLPQSDAYIFKESGGGGTQPRPGGAQPPQGNGRVISPDNWGGNIEAIAKGDVKVLGATGN